MRSLLARLVPRTLEAFRVHVEVGERDALLDQQVAAGDEHDLPRGEAGEQEHRPVADRRHRRVGLDLLVRDDRRRQRGLDRLHLDARERAPIDPDRPAVERLARPDRIEPHHVAVVLADAFRAGEPIAVVVVEAELQRQRQHLLRLEQRERPGGRAPTSCRSRKTTAPPTRHPIPRRSSGCRSPRRSPDRSSWAGSADPCGRRRCSCARARPAPAAAAGAAR